jgi:glycosyltransferase involved in cell wall biosynthesis
MNYLNVLVLVANFVAGFPLRVVVREAATFFANIKTIGKIMKMILPKLMKLLYPLADRVVAVSNGVKTDLVASLKLNSDSIKVIYNPVGYTELLERSEEQVSHKWFEKVDNEKEPVILAVGRFSPEKDYETLLRAFAKVCQKRAARLIILGEGPTKEATRLLAQELKIEDFVDFPGFISNPFPYMKKANVFVLSSNQEGMPNSLLQATILGTQIVSTDCKSGPAEILENGKYGILVPVGDSERLAEAILKKFDEPKNDVEQTLIEKYDSKRIALQYLKAADYCCD